MLRIGRPTDWTRYPPSKQPPSILRLKSATRFIPTPTASSARAASIHLQFRLAVRFCLAAVRSRSPLMRLPGVARRTAVEAPGGRKAHGEEQGSASHTRAQHARLSATVQRSCSPPAARRSRSTLTARRSDEKGGDTSSEVEEKGVPSHPCARRARLSEAVTMELGDGGEPNEANQGKMNRAPNPFEWVMLWAHVPFP